MKSALLTERNPQGQSGTALSRTLLGLLLIGLAYHAILILSPLLHPYRFPIPYAVPIFDTPFVLAALAVGYLGLERHRLLQDFRSAAIGIPLWLCALLALVHILAQPDYPGTPGVNPGVAPYFFLLSYLTGFASIGLATHYGHRALPLSGRQRLWIGLGAFGASLLTVVTILQLQPVLPSMVMKPGRFTPFGLWVFGVSTGLLGAWALWGGIKQFWGEARDGFAGFLLLAALIWLLGLIGFLLFPFRYAISWYVAGLARPLGVTAIFVGLLQEQVWLYREARARQRDLEALNTAGQALATSLDAQQIVETITTAALEVSGAVGTILYRLDALAQVLRPVGYAGFTQGFAASHEIPIGVGVTGLAVAERQPVWTANLQVDPRLSYPSEIQRRVCEERLKAALAVPILHKSGEVFGALVACYEEEREFAKTDLDLLSAFGSQASEALENVRSFEQLALKARHDESLQAFSQRLLAASQEETILHEAVQLTQDLLRADYVGLYLLDPRAASLCLQAGSGWGPGSIGMTTGPLSTESWEGYTFLQKESVAVEDLAQERRVMIPSLLTAHGVQAGLAVPFGVHDDPIGVMAAYCRRPHRFSDEESRVLLSLTQVSALALDKVRLYAELQTNVRRLQETQAQLMYLAGRVAHEVNNPLGIIKTAMRLLSDEPVEDLPNSELFQIMDAEVGRIARIVQEILAFSRPSTTDEIVDVNAIIYSLEQLLTPNLQPKGIVLTLLLEPELPHVRISADHLKQVILNMVRNAEDAMSEGGQLTIQTARSHAGVQMSITDTGCGIPAENISRLFDPFFTTKGKGPDGGTGLGLAVSRGIIRNAEGDIEAESELRKGSTFRVSLPACKV